MHAHATVRCRGQDDGGSDAVRRLPSTGFRGQAEFPPAGAAAYPHLVKQLKEYRDGNRVSEIMGPTVKDLSDEQIKAPAQSN